MPEIRKAVPVNPNATKKASELLQYLYDTAGNGIITGQHTQTRAMEELTLLRELTGKEPKLLGFELLSYSPTINTEGASEDCLDEIEANRGTVEYALQWAKTSGGIVTLTFHWYAPTGGEDKAFYQEHTDFDASQVLIEGTKERQAFYQDMDALAGLLARFQAEDIPVLWRPFHESDGTWFWWGSKGPAVAAGLYRLMYDYYTEVKHLDHLLWVWNSEIAEGYPGDDCVDVISKDIYAEKKEPTDFHEEYERLVNATSRNKVAAIAECGWMPDMQKLSESRIPWAYFMTWSRWFCLKETTNTYEMQKAVYAHPYSVKNEISAFQPGESRPLNND